MGALHGVNVISAVQYSILHGRIKGEKCALVFNIA